MPFTDTRDRVGTPYYDGTSFTLIAYFPAWPIASHLAAKILPIDAAMVTLSNLCTIVGFVFLFDWSRRLAGARVAAACVLLAATFPGAVSFAAGATEGPFFMLAAICLWLLERDSFYPAAIVACIGTATRPTGVALAMLVPFYYWLRRRHLPVSRRMANFFLLGAISVSGAVGYETFMWHRYKTPTAYFEAQKHWTVLDQNRIKSEAAAGIDRHSLAFYRQHLGSPQVWNRGIALLILVITIAGFYDPRGLPRVIYLFPLVIFLMTSLPGHGLRISSLTRYESAAAPLFYLVAMWFCGVRASSSGGEIPRDRDGLLDVAGSRFEPDELAADRGRSTSFAGFNLGLVALLLLQFAVQIYYAWLFPRQIWVG